MSVIHSKSIRNISLWMFCMIFTHFLQRNPRHLIEVKQTSTLSTSRSNFPSKGTNCPHTFKLNDENPVSTLWMHDNLRDIMWSSSTVETETRCKVNPGQMHEWHEAYSSDMLLTNCFALLSCGFQKLERKIGNLDIDVAISDAHDLRVQIHETE